MKRQFKVTLEVPEGATIADCKEYILDSVQTWCGALRPPFACGDNDPGNPMFGLNRDSVRVVQVRK